MVLNHYLCVCYSLWVNWLIAMNSIYQRWLSIINNRLNYKREYYTKHCQHFQAFCVSSYMVVYFKVLYRPNIEALKLYYVYFFIKCNAFQIISSYFLQSYIESFKIQRVVVCIFNFLPNFCESGSKNCIMKLKFVL